MNSGRKVLGISGVAATLLFSITFSCVIPSGSEPEAFQMSMKDTVAPFGRIAVMLSNAAEESTLIMKLFPGNIALTAQMNKTNDTASFSLPLSISGNSLYMLIPQAGNNSQMNRYSDTLFFHTWPKENEPNNSIETADSISSRIFGSLSTIDDVDWYVADTAFSKRCVLRNYGGTANLRVARTPGAPVIESAFRDTQIVAIPDNARGMAFIIVYTPSKSAGGYYEITTLR